MKAAVLHEFGQPLTIEDVETPRPAPDDALVQVAACGIDGTDLKLLDGFGYTPELPFVMGHEPAGVVAEVGSAVRDVRPGDRVVPYIFLIPPADPWYKSDREQLCPNMEGVVGVQGAAGGYAQFLNVPARQLVTIPAGLAWRDAAVLCDAGLTAWHAIHRSRVSLGETALVIGVGGVGSFALQFAKLTGARVIAVDQSQAKTKRAMEFGAEFAIDCTQQNVVDEVRRLTNQQGVDCVLDLVGQTSTLTDSVNCLRAGGRLVVVGYTPDEYAISGKRLAQNEYELIGSRGGSRRDLAAVVQLAASGRIRSIVSDVRPLEEVNQALEQLRRGDVLGRLVLEISPA